MPKSKDTLNIGFWFPRPDRGKVLADQLRSMNHQVTIYHSAPISGSQKDVIKTPYQFFRGIFLLFKTQHDVYFTSRSFLPVFQLFLLSLLRGKKYLYTINSPIWEYYGERRQNIIIRLVAHIFYPLIFKLVVSKASGVVANSVYLTDMMKLRFPKMKEKFHTVYNGIDYQSIDKGKPILSEWPGSGIRLLSVTTLNFTKKTIGTHLILNAFEKVAKVFPECSLIIAAKGSNPKSFDSLREKISTLTCAKKIAFFENRRDIPDLLASSDIFLFATHPTSSDSLPRVLLEAQAAQVPCITTHSVGCPEAVNHEKTGIVVAYDLDALVEALNQLIRDKELRLKMKSEAKPWVMKTFNWEKMALNYEILFQNIIKIPKGKIYKKKHKEQSLLQNRLKPKLTTSR